VFLRKVAALQLSTFATQSAKPGNADERNSIATHTQLIVASALIISAEVGARLSVSRSNDTALMTA
jgi:hypothetical protein